MSPIFFALALINPPYWICTRSGLQQCNNIATAQKLGCKISDFQGSFPHACRSVLLIYVVLDSCHMLKLARNALGFMKVFVTPKGGKISWENIETLYKIQQDDILHIGNKLKTKHMQWHEHKMNVADFRSGFCNLSKVLLSAKIFCSETIISMNLC